jgi:hypothetical protein
MPPNSFDKNGRNTDIGSRAWCATIVAMVDQRSAAMYVISTRDLERLIQSSFPAKSPFCAESDLGLAGPRLPAVAFVHGGPDPYLDPPVDAWLQNRSVFVSLYALLNRLCRSGALVPGEYAVTGNPAAC